jgi:hypothetical protein
MVGTPLNLRGGDRRDVSRVFCSASDAGARLASGEVREFSGVDQKYLAAMCARG